jgi:hypothetical protein
LTFSTLTGAAATVAPIGPTKGGSASHLKPVSQKDLADRYGYFFDYIAM